MKSFCSARELVRLTAMHHRHQRSIQESSEITVNDCKSKYAVMCATKSGLCCSLMHVVLDDENGNRLCTGSECCICLTTSMQRPVKQSSKGLLSVKINHKPAGSPLSERTSEGIQNITLHRAET